MAAGDYITKANYRSMYTGSAWEISESYSATEASHKYLWTRKMYISAQSFVLQMSVDQQFFATIKLHWDVYYYNVATSAWVKADDYTVHTGPSDYDYKTRRITHNRNESANLNDVSNNHAWFVYLSVTDSSGNENNYDAYFNIWAGATEMANYSDSTCDFLWKPGNPIYGLQPYTTTSNNTTPSGSGDRKHSMRGTPISVNSGTARYIFTEG